MKILVTGNLGYLGPVLVNFLKKSIPNSQIYGYDTGYFAHLLTGVENTPESFLTAQYYGDIREISNKHLEGMDGVVHLAAISNDPMGNQFENVTIEINRKASARLASLAIKAGVKNFVFASSCSVYGQAGDSSKKESDSTNPLTSYAKSKVGTEEDISCLDLNQMCFTSLRFATACGWSPRLRLDLVLNDFVASAITSREIAVLSDGSPWRPLIDVEDMSRVIQWALCRDSNNGGNYLIVNAGRNECNYQIRNLAEAVANSLPGTSVRINEAALPDKRSYSVDFSLYKFLAPNHQPIVSLNDSINRLVIGLKKINLINQNFRESELIRLNVIRQHLKYGILSKELRWLEFN